MNAAYQVAIVAAGIFFLNGLLTGVWKYLQILSSPDAKAHPYVDIAHRTSLLYSFAAILIAQFVEISRLPDTAELFATLSLVVYFAMAISSYMVQGMKRETENQLAKITPIIRWFMWSLILFEIAGFMVLFYGVIEALNLVSLRIK